ncbi:MAG: phosphoenolpyruvate synthase [Cyclobacteriaceae bacterium]
MGDFIKYFDQISLENIDQVGGKNASLGELYKNLGHLEIRVPYGFATTAEAYWDFISHNRLEKPLIKLLGELDKKDFSNLEIVGGKIRDLMLTGVFPKKLQLAIEQGFQFLSKKYGNSISLAVRSSATAEDLPQASFAGQQESYLNIIGVEQLLEACHKCYASLFTDRAIKYREDQGFDHMKVALSVGVQLMVRADKGASGVIFTLDPDSGFDQVIHIAGVWGLGENIVQGTVNPDEFYVFKPTLKTGKQAILSHRLGSKDKTMIYAEAPATGTINLDTPTARQNQFVLTNEEVATLAKWSLAIEDHYQRPMDLEWAKDGIDQQLYMLQARPETVHSARKDHLKIVTYKLKEKGKVLCHGIGLGNKIAQGKARVLHTPKEAYKLQSGEVLVTRLTNPDWDPILKKTAAIITDQGGRTSHAAIVAREVGAVAVVATGNATEVIKDGQELTVSCAEGDNGVIYEGLLNWDENVIDPGELREPTTKPMLILGDPQQAFKLSFYPTKGIGLMRLEFIINNSIRVHPLALKYFDQLEDNEVKHKIEKLTHHYPNKEDYFVHHLAEAVATIAAAFYPKDVIVRLSDFKSNEYANLIGGTFFEPVESNPMLGFRGASRYYHKKYKEGFAMECSALRIVREEMGLENVKVMVPFCRTLTEAKKTIALMKEFGLERGKKDLQIYMMTEIPSNVILAEEFAYYFDGFSIGSNDLTQLTLGVDRDSELLSDIFDVNDPAVRQMIRMVIASAHKTGTVIGLCGQAPSDYPEFAQFLVRHGINSISFNPDALFKGIENINKAEEKYLRHVSDAPMETEKTNS